VDNPNVSREAEMSVIGCMMLTTVALDIVRHSSKPDHFWVPAHRIIFTKIVEIFPAGSTYDPNVFTAKVSKEDLEAMGGLDYLFECAYYVTTARNVSDYVQIVAEKAYRRNVGKQAADLARGVMDADLTTSEIEAKVAYLQNTHASRKRPILGLEEIDIEGEEYGTRTHFKSIDALMTTGGYPGGQVSVVKAYHKGGKTAWMITTAVLQAQAGERVLYATFADLDPKGIKRRILRNVCGWGRRPDNLDLEGKYTSALTEIGFWDFDVYDATEHDTGSEIEAFAGWFSTHASSRPDKPYNAVYLDYAQKIRTGDKRAYNELREAVIASDKLARLAKRHPQTAFIVGSQVTEGKDGARSITKGSKAWEEDAGLVLELERKEIPGYDDECSIKVAYNRFGRGGMKFPIRWEGDRVRFTP
jgi:hypothetical protein